MNGHRVMNIGYLALISLVVALLLVLPQRVERKRRKLALAIVLLCCLLIRHNAFLKGDLHAETLLGFLFGASLSGLFWLLVGRYNPVGSSDDIRVIGMDD